MSTLDNPVIVASVDGLCAFEGVEAAERYMEPIDVQNGEYLFACTSKGERLEIGVEVTRKPWLSRLSSASAPRTRLVPSGEMLEPKELARQLKSWLADAGQDHAPLEEISVQQLVALAVRYFLIR